MNGLPRLSVVIPTFNRSHLISRAIQSVLSQEEDLFEIIVADDDSPDGTREVVERLVREDGRLRYIKLDNRGGTAGARNAGVANTRGEWIVFLDDDDEM